MAGVGYLLVLPADRDKDVVPHLHGEVQPGQGVTHSHPQRRVIAGYRSHGSHFLLPPVPSSTLWEARKRGQNNQDVKNGREERGSGGMKVFLSTGWSWEEREVIINVFKHHLQVITRLHDKQLPEMSRKLDQSKAAVIPSCDTISLSIRDILLFLKKRMFLVLLLLKVPHRLCCS